MKTATIGGQNARRRKGTAPAGLEIPHPYDKPIEQFPLKDNLVEIRIILPADGERNDPGGVAGVLPSHSAGGILAG